MIGIFDSGFGGLSILKKVCEAMPDYAYIYYGDNLRAPYGARSQAEIYEFTLAGVEELFRRGANLVVLACNTSSAVALRKIQQEWLPIKYPAKKVLGIIIPTAEVSDQLSRTKNIGIWATEATVKSGVYECEMLRIDQDLKITQIACPMLVPIIEAGNRDARKLNKTITKYITELLGYNQQIDTLVLGCTHYALIETEIRALLPVQIKLVTQGGIVAAKLRQYVTRHQELDLSIGKGTQPQFLTTSANEEINRIARLFYGELIDFEVVNR